MVWWCIDIFQNYEIKMCAFAVNTFPSFTQNVTAHPQPMVHCSTFDWLLWECAAAENTNIPPTERIGNSGWEKSDKNQNPDSKHTFQMFHICVTQIHNNLLYPQISPSEFFTKIHFLSKIGFLYCLWNILAKIYVYYFWIVCKVSFRYIYRLSLDKNAHFTVIDWLELVEAVQKQSCK